MGLQMLLISVFVSDQLVRETTQWAISANRPPSPTVANSALEAAAASAASDRERPSP